MSSAIEELESITKASVREMKRWGLQPIDWEVYIDEVTEELWVNVWFEPGLSITERRKFGLYLFKSELNKSTRTLPVRVNVTYEDNATDNGIAVWWMNG
ncbi:MULTISPECIES: hypothetical protein [Halorubrum]|uniref:hypothetical protein n=1 Tax=Halorubrum TaxID=56688 RepID=UPI00067815AB|nr:MULTISPECIES: hypothetical protein [Halorubrum]TKX68264.1 hypothetical protein EXE40_13055 [Halorubrum sp. GN11GM_10-3_MGM]